MYSMTSMKTNPTITIGLVWQNRKIGPMVWFSNNQNQADVTMILYREFFMIHQLKADGLNHSQIARRLNLHRKTVRRYLSSKPGDTARVPRKARSSTLDRYRGHLRRRVTEHPQLCATRLLCEIMAQGYIGCILILRDYLRQILPRVLPKMFTHKFAPNHGF